MKVLSWLYLLIVTIVFFPNMASSSPVDPDPLQTVSSVDLDRYLGKWYEIAAIPQSFQTGCAGTTADYSLRSDGYIDVLNSCRLEDGTIRSARGKAWSVDSSNAKLKVQFAGPVAGDYWIIELSDDYSYAVVGHPDRNSLWILSRTAEISPISLETLRWWNDIY